MRKLIYILLACATSAQAEITSHSAIAEIDDALAEVYQNLDADWENSAGKEYLDIVGEMAASDATDNDTEAAIANAVAFLNWDLFGLNESYDTPIELDNWHTEEIPAYALEQKPWNYNQVAPGYAIDKVNEILVNVYKHNITGEITTTEFYNHFNSDTGATAFNNAIDALKDINTHLPTIVDNSIALVAEEYVTVEAETSWEYYTSAGNSDIYLVTNGDQEDYLQVYQSVNTELYSYNGTAGLHDGFETVQDLVDHYIANN